MDFIITMSLRTAEEAPAAMTPELTNSGATLVSWLPITRLTFNEQICRKCANRKKVRDIPFQKRIWKSPFQFLELFYNRFQKENIVTCLEHIVIYLNKIPVTSIYLWAVIYVNITQRIQR